MPQLSSSSSSLTVPENHFQPPPISAPFSCSSTTDSTSATSNSNSKSNSNSNSKRKVDPVCEFIVPSSSSFPSSSSTQHYSCPHLEAYLPTFLDTSDINELSSFMQSHGATRTAAADSAAATTTIQSHMNSSKHGIQLMSRVHLKSLLDSHDNKNNNKIEELNILMAMTKVEHWLESIRKNRHRYWKQEQKAAVNHDHHHTYTQQKRAQQDQDNIHCKYCSQKGDKMTTSFPPATKNIMSLDDNDLLMECLDCSLIACGPTLLPPLSSSLKSKSTSSSSHNNSTTKKQKVLKTHTTKTKRHLIQHFLISGHTLGITCGKNGYIYCAKCGTFVHNQVLEREVNRVNVLMNAKWLGWDRSRIIQRSYGFSYNPMDDFVHVPVSSSVTNSDSNNSTSLNSSSKHKVKCGIDSSKGSNESSKEMICGKGRVVWKGFRALYPTDVPHALIDAGHKTYQRLHFFRELLIQHNIKDSIISPIGFYNMGQTCYLGCVLQCVMNLLPLQHYFLKEAKHDHSSCKILRSHLSHRKKSKSGSSHYCNESSSICIGCEIDKLFLEYYSSVNGFSITTPLSVFCESSQNIDSIDRIDKGLPISPTNLLVQLWKCKSMSLLRGYEQRDAHEFLQVFLDILSKDCRQFHSRANKVREEISLSEGFKCQNVSDPQSDGDIVSSLFQGFLRSVLICTNCGFKRSQKEAFLNISIPLDKEFALQNDRSTADSKTRTTRERLDLAVCLEHFVSPESLCEPVDCQWCKSKTATLKQHTFSKLPEVLCLHLKRFDAARYRKIDDLVSYPSQLNMGAYMPHWREVGQKDVMMKYGPGTNVRSLSSAEINSNATHPELLYDLCATIDHTGTLYQGHYISNVKIEKQWYRCNDAFISATSEEEVLRSSDVYMMFYIRRRKAH